MKRKHNFLVEEIEKVKKRRQEREEEREEFERLRLEENRLREQEQFGDWQKKEDEFHLLQAKNRSKIRIRVRFSVSVFYVFVLSSLTGGARKTSGYTRKERPSL